MTGIDGENLVTCGGKFVKREVISRANPFLGQSYVLSVFAKPYDYRAAIFVGTLPYNTDIYHKVRTFTIQYGHLLDNTEILPDNVDFYYRIHKFLLL